MLTHLQIQNALDCRVGGIKDTDPQLSGDNYAARLTGVTRAVEEESDNNPEFLARRKQFFLEIMENV